ncbi:MAG TPA: carbohydrate-binding protein [Glycomyces sp.]|nr:carbohydrate-binding protein [Glycomyces sp.]
MSRRRRRLRAGVAVGLAGLVATATTAIAMSAAQAATVRYEAEDSSAACGGTIDSDHSGYSGSGFCNTPNAVGETARFTVDSPSDGTATLTVSYANGGTGDRPADVLVDGAVAESGVAFAPTGGWSTWDTVAVTVPVSAGSNTVELAATTSGGLANIDYLEAETADTGEPTSTRFEAEESPAVCDGSIETEHAGFSGTGFCDSDNMAGATAEFTFGAGTGGQAQLVVGFANGSDSSRAADVLVNGTRVGSTSFPATGAWTTWSTQSLTLNLAGGATTVSFAATGSAGLPNIDYLDSSIGEPPEEDNEAPSAPSGLEAASVTGSSVGLEWNAATDNVGVAGYEVFRVGSPDASVGAASGTSFTVTGLAPGQTYHFYVVAHDVAGNTSASSNTVSATTDEDAEPPGGDVLYVSPNGSDGASGTESSPTTLTSAISRIEPGGTIYLRGGDYALSQTVHIEPGNDGLSGNRTELFAYQGETPILNFSGQSENSANRGLAMGGDWWHVKGITVENAGDNGILLGGNDNVIERVITRRNADTGLQLSRYTAGAPRDQWPSNNLIISSVSHDNVDSDGEDADGFAPKLTVGPGNVFRNTVAHNNIDDGYDLFTKPDTGPIGEVVIENSLVFENGTLSDGSQAGAGDKNGFKLGGDDIAVDHVVRDNIAYDNGKHGFTYNSNPGSITVTGNASIGNAERNFNFDAGSHDFSGNTSCDSGDEDRIVGNDNGGNQFWNGSNGSRCSNYDGAMDWRFASDGTLIVTFGGTQVLP